MWPRVPAALLFLVPVQFECAYCKLRWDKSVCQMNETLSKRGDRGAYSSCLVDALSVLLWQLCEMCFVMLLCVFPWEVLAQVYINATNISLLTWWLIYWIFFCKMKAVVFHSISIDSMILLLRLWDKYSKYVLSQCSLNVISECFITGTASY